VKRSTIPARASARPAADSASSRRTPLQDRSRKRVELILDASARVFLDRGYDAATTEEIARLAGTSIGSVYQFFPNKLAIFNAIAARYVERAQALFDTFMTPSAIERPWQELLDGAIDAFVAFHVMEPGFRAILVNWRVSADMVLANDDVNREFARRAEGVLAAQAPGLTPARRSLVATMIIEMISAALMLCVRRPPSAEAVIAETKTMLRRYIEPIVTENAKAPGGKPAARSGPRSNGSPSSSRGTRSRAPSSGTRSPRR
jgi:AcrR family transcriptional regulator